MKNDSILLNSNTIKSLKKISSGIPIPKDPTVIVESINNMVQAYKEYKVVQEQEISKRVQIKAMRDIQIEQIRAMKETMIFYMAHTFEERAYTLSKMFDVLDQGIASNNSEIVDKTLHGIITTVQTNPLSNFHDFARKMEDDDYILTL